MARRGVFTGCAAAACVLAAVTGVLADNNCLACVRCGGSWAVATDNGTAYAQCLYPPAAGAVDGTMYGGLFTAPACTAGAPSANNGTLQCASACGPQGPCPSGSLCGECLFAKSNTQCVTPHKPTYTYNAAVHAVCKTIEAQGMPIATNAALLYGMSLPACDCPPGQSYSVEASTCSGGTVQTPQNSLSSAAAAAAASSVGSNF